MKIAVIGSGVSGLGAAWLLDRAGHQVVVYEKERRFGGHSNTATAPGPDGDAPVDTGFIVYNEPNYPNLAALFEHLGVETRWSDMSFGVSLDDGAFEYGSGWSSFLGQRRNAVDPRFWRLLADIVRFNRDAPKLLDAARSLDLTLGDYLERERYGRAFAERYLLPMAACIWSASLGSMLAYPAQTFVRFFLNHGLLRVAGQLRWRTVVGGSRSYVARLLAPLEGRARLGCGAVGIRRAGGGVEVRDARGHAERFDRVVIAAHADQALALLSDADDRERAVLGAFGFQNNVAFLHGDPALMPRRRRVWSSWNYVAGAGDWDRPVSLTYWMNRLQGLDRRRDVFVSLNPSQTPNPAVTWGRWDYEHPLFDRAALAAQRALPSIQGARDVWFCGAWTGYGFHEDGLSSGLDAAEAIGARRPWEKPRARLYAGVGAPQHGAHALPGFDAVAPLPAPALLRTPAA